MKILKNITHIFFDLDHTLYDFDENAKQTFQHIFEKRNIPNTEKFMEYFKPVNDYYWSLLVKNEITREQLRIKRLEDTFAQMNISISKEKIEKIADDFIENLTNFTVLFEGTHHTLQYLKNKYSLHIITNGPDLVQEKKLENTKLRQYFTTVTNSEKAKSAKPNKEIFCYAMRQANAKPQESLMIGDSLSADIQGALRVGMRAIWCNYNNEKKQEIEDFVEITNLVELINIL